MEQAMDAFGGRPLTEAEYARVLQTEKKRRRCAILFLLTAAVLLSAGAIWLAQDICESNFQKAHLKALGFNPSHEKANYNAYCMILYHNQLHGTDYDAFFFDDGVPPEVDRETEMDMLEAYYVGYLHASRDERLIEFVPEYTFEQFKKELTRIAQEKKERLLAERDFYRPVKVCIGVGAAAVLCFALMAVMATGESRLDAHQLACRTGLLNIPFRRTKGNRLFVKLAEAMATDRHGPQYYSSLKIKRWHTPCREWKRILSRQEMPVLLVMADGKLTYYLTD